MQHYQGGWNVVNLLVSYETSHPIRHVWVKKIRGQQFFGQISIAAEGFCPIYFGANGPVDILQEKSTLTTTYYVTCFLNWYGPSVKSAKLLVPGDPYSFAIMSVLTKPKSLCPTCRGKCLYSLSSTLHSYSPHSSPVTSSFSWYWSWEWQDQSFLGSRACQKPWLQSCSLSGYQNWMHFKQGWNCVLQEEEKTFRSCESLS